MYLFKIITIVNTGFVACLKSFRALKNLDNQWEIFKFKGPNTHPIGDS